ncbi:MAG: hypothetical protein ACW987_18095 [Candidatus Thorarchaeota archaeon]|jgi:hypothetical protein
MPTTRKKKNLLKPRVLLTIIADFDSVPSDSELQDILEAVRQYGGVTEATLEMMEPFSRDLLEDL